MQSSLFKSLIVSLVVAFGLQGEASSRQNPDILTNILAEAGPGKVVLFDLDDTLIDCQPRTYNIIEAFLNLPETHTTYPDLVEKVKSQLKVENVGFSKPSTALWALGVRKTDNRTTAFLNAVDAYWLSQLQADFSFIHFDAANPGAVEYVNKIHNKGATVIYFTGRSQQKSEAGTRISLAKLGFPLDDRAFPTLKDDNGNFSSDADYKAKIAPTLEHYGKIIAFFDNEPANDLAVRASLPDISVVFLNTNSSGADMDQLVSNPTILWLNNFIAPEGKIK